MEYTCPECGSRFRYEESGEVFCPTCQVRVRVEAVGSPWDRFARGDWMNAFIETVKRSLITPNVFFREVAAGTGWWRAYLYSVLISFVVFAIAAAYQAGFSLLAVSAEMAEAGVGLFPMTAMLAVVPFWMLIVLSILFVPVATAAVLLLQSALYHLCLLLLGAARSGTFEKTFRVLGYCSGPQLLQIVPILGGVVAAGWQLALMIIGLKEAHATTYGRSALAVFLPLIVCCGVGLMLAMAIAGAVVAGVATSGS